MPTMSQEVVDWPLEKDADDEPGGGRLRGGRGGQM